MKHRRMLPAVWLATAIICTNSSCLSLKKGYADSVLQMNGLAAFWDFQKEENGYISKGPARARLQYGTQSKPKLIQEGPLSGGSVFLDGSQYLNIPHAATGALNIKTNQITVVAWIKRANEKTGFIAGMWNEHEGGGKRQYGLFVSLPYYNGANQVCGHISKTGLATPPFPFSIEYSASLQTVPTGQWVCVAFTYDGEYIRSYLNGKFEKRQPELIKHTKGFRGYPNGLVQSKNPYYFPDGMGNNGSDFTVGAVQLKEGMGNFFKGQIGGIAIFNRALAEKELMKMTVN